MATGKRTDKLKMTSDPFPTWKVRPPGPEQLELERMFTSKQIDETTTADNVRKSNKMFHKFSSTVFSSHFRKTKAKFRLSASVANGSPKTSELGSSQNQIKTPKSYKTIVDSDSRIEFKNAPFFVWTYTDHEKKNDFVCVAISIFSGSRNINFSLSEDGMKVIVHYTWPSAIYKADELFGEAINNKNISITHPKVHAFVSKMLESGITENSTPQGQIIINLRRQVKREIGSWKKDVIKVNDTKIILLEFTARFSAYQKSLIVDDAETIIGLG